MKIISYNINGLNSFVTKNKIIELFNEHNADVYCFQEVRANDLKIKDLLAPYLNDYTYVTSLNNVKKGYAGVMTLMKNDIYKQSLGVEENVFSYNGDLTYTSGRIINVEFKDFYLINVYVVNSGNKIEIRKDFDNQFREYLKTLSKPYIVCGDFNVCATELDYWGDYKKAINSMPGLMDFEIDGFSKLLNECKLTDTFRMLRNDERKYSWFSPMGGALDKGRGWRIDYFLCSEDMKNKIKSTEIFEGYQGADHSPIELVL